MAYDEASAAICLKKKSVPIWWITLLLCHCVAILIGIFCRQTQTKGSM
jgi:hypothetical protein